jgi:hypothetical protein
MQPVLETTRYEHYDPTFMLQARHVHIARLKHANRMIILQCDIRSHVWATMKYQAEFLEEGVLPTSALHADVGSEEALCGLANHCNT